MEWDLEVKGPDEGVVGQFAHRSLAGLLASDAEMSGVEAQGFVPGPRAQSLGYPAGWLVTHLLVYPVLSLSHTVKFRV